jgi:uncharacterized protein (DUF2236 family)
MTELSQGRRDRDRFAPSNRLKAKIVANVQASVGGTEDDLDDYYEPIGDAGLMGLDSSAWVVHGELASMLYGGFAALMLQTLHPRAMAGVAQHSNFRNDPTGRLVRTARFVAGTTFGATPFVDQLFAEVLAVHGHVKGHTDEGVPYSANDPDLLTWVHITEVSQFLRGYLRYGPHHVSEEAQDRYFSETSVIALRLGAQTVPSSRAEVASYIERMRSELHATPECLDAVHFLRKTSVAPTDALLVRITNVLAHRIVVGCAIDLLPDFARRELSLQRYARVKAVPRRLAGRMLAKVLRWALGPSRVMIVSRERILGVSEAGAP